VAVAVANSTMKLEMNSDDGKGMSLDATFKWKRLIEGQKNTKPCSVCR